MATTCKVCMKRVLDSEDGLQCDDDCQLWFHIKCVGVTKTEYAQYANNVNKKWHCQRVDCPATYVDVNRTLLNKVDELLSKFSNLATKEEIGVMNNKIDNIRTEFTNLSAKIKTFEPRLEKLENVVAKLKLEPSGSTVSQLEGFIEEVNDRQRRTRNVIVYGLMESKSAPADAKNHDSRMVNLILKKANLEGSFANTRFFRLGKKGSNEPRPIKLCMPSQGDATTLFQCLSNIEDLGVELKGITLGRDRTLRERQHLSELRDTLKTRNEAGEKNLTIKYVNGVPKIVPKN